jgi:hypothetical protein
MPADAVLCVVCPVLRPKGTPRKPNNPPVCDGCGKRLEADLNALPASYAAVDAEPVRGMTEIRSRVFESKPPLNINALSLLGPGEDTPVAVLDFWAQDWAGILDQPPPAAYVTTMCLWLAARLPWALANHPAIDDFAHSLRELTNALRPYEGGDDRGEYVGRCPRLLGDDRCNTPLYVDPYVDQIQCTRCRQQWKRKAGEWMHLRAQQLGAGVEAA